MNLLAKLGLVLVLIASSRKPMRVPGLTHEAY